MRNTAHASTVHHRHLELAVNVDNCLQTPMQALVFCRAVLASRYNGFSLESIKDCPKNLPRGVPAGQCAHIALVELDARQAYKQAVAFWATGNYKYAQTTLKIIDAWSTTNTVS